MEEVAEKKEMEWGNKEKWEEEEEDGRYSKKASHFFWKTKASQWTRHNGTKLVRVIKLNSLQFKLSFVNFHGMILKCRKNHRNRATKDKTFSSSIPFFLPICFFLAFLFFPFSSKMNENVSFTVLINLNFANMKIRKPEENWKEEGKTK